MMLLNRFRNVYNNKLYGHHCYTYYYNDEICWETFKYNILLILDGQDYDVDRRSIILIHYNFYELE